MLLDTTLLVNIMKTMLHDIILFVNIMQFMLTETGDDKEKI